MKLRPSASTAVSARFLRSYAHSASLCQCSSRMPAGLQAHIDARELGRYRQPRIVTRAPSRR